MTRHPRNTKKDGVCELCERAVDALIRHQLIPKTRHRSQRMRRDHKLEHLRADALWLCQPCHEQVHAIFSEKELGDVYNTRERLLAQPDIGQFIAWLRAKPSGFVARSYLKRRF